MHPLLPPGAEPSPSFQTLPKILWEEVPPTPIRAPKLAALSTNCAEILGLRTDAPEFLPWLNGEIRVPGDQRISTRYAGHQFGHWAGQLGDGRAISLLEFKNAHGERWELQTKGSGLTPFSRMGDGKAVIRSSVREFLCSEAMHGLGIPTTRALALVVGQDPVQRETVERSAIVARAFPSNLRFGHFEYCLHFNEPEALARLIAYTRENFYPECASANEMFAEIVKRTAELMAQWMSVGFSHGVMNTDNMSVLGLTIDYGPFGFLESTKLDFVCNHSDDRGRYAYDQQPAVALWNLERLGICFLKEVAKEEVLSALQTFWPTFTEKFFTLFRAKMGLITTQSGDEDFVQITLKLMDTYEADFTAFFRNLPKIETLSTEEFLKQAELDPTMPSVQNWYSNYRERLAQESTSPSERAAQMNTVNPKIVLKNYIAQEVIEAVEQDNYEPLHRWLKALETPYGEHPELEEYAGPTPARHRHIEVSCSS